MNFIPSGTDIVQGHEQLKHFALMSKKQLVNRWETDKGQDILQALKEGKWSRESIQAQVGSLYGQLDLRGISLADQSLSNHEHLNNIDFFAANLRRTDFSRSNLTGSFFSEADLRGANFEWSVMDDVLVDNVQFDYVTNFRGVDLHKINFVLATLLEDLAIGQQRIANLEKARPLLAKFLKYSCDYGRSFSRFFLWSFWFIFFYGVLYYLLPAGVYVGGDKATNLSFIDSLYFSTITFTTLGYGDILPISWIGKLLVMSEVLLGFSMLGLLVAILARRVLGR